MRKLDALQRRYRASAFLYAVQKKYSDDNGGYLAALVTYYGFLSVFPLLLAVFTVAAFVLAGDQSAVTSLEKHVSGYPVVGPAAAQLTGKHLHGSAAGIVIGVLGLIWGAQGVAQAAEFTMQQAWNVPVRQDYGFVPRLIRGMGWYAVVGLSVVLSTFVTSLGSVFSWAGGPLLSALIALLFNMAFFVGSFRILSPSVAGTRDLLPGAAFAAVCWTFLTGLGVGLAHKLAHSNQLYGTFASVLGLLAFLYLTARLTIYGIEANVVRARHLWPRSLTGEDLEPADRRQMEALAMRQERYPHMAVRVEFHDPNNSSDISAAAERTDRSDGDPTKTATRPDRSSEKSGAFSSRTSSTGSP